MSSSILPLALIFLLVLASGYFSLMETALNEGRHGKLEKLIQDGDKDAIAAMKFLESPTKALSTAQIGITVTGIFAGLTSIPLSEIISAQINFFEQAEIVSLILALAVVAFTMLLFGGFLPKRTAQHSPEKFLLNHHRSIKFVVALMTPLVYLFEKISGGVMILLDMNPKTTDAVTEDEVKDLIERIHMRWLDISDGLERNLKIIRESNQQIFPVGEGSLDEFRGVIYAKDLLDAVLNLQPDEKINLSALLKKPVFVTRTMDIFRIVERFKSSGESAAIVNDEYGGVIGLVTLDDIAGEIVGTKDIEQPRERKIIQKDDAYIVDGLCDIDDFKRLFNFETLPNEEHEYFQTMGGFLTSLFGYIPKVGETYDWNGLRFEVLKMDRARVEKICIKEIKQ